MEMEGRKNFDAQLLSAWTSRGGQKADTALDVESNHQLQLKVPDNLSHFSRHDLVYFEARSSIFSGRHESLYRVSILGVIPHLGSRSKTRSAKFLSLTLTLIGSSPLNVMIP